MEQENIFKWKHYQPDIILTKVLFATKNRLGIKILYTTANDLLKKRGKREICNRWR
ncbi:TPA: hypothetical protein VGS93_003978 [Bacillus cereus]|nr:hypothetical protein [Bacillus cereus]